MTEKTMASKEVRECVRRVSLGIIREHARATTGATQEWLGVLGEIEALYHYDAWDVLFILAATLRLHPHTGVPAAFRRQAAEYKQQRREMTRDLRHFQEKWMTGERPMAQSLEVMESAHPAYALVETRGRPSDWMLDEFAGHLGVILVDTRWAKQARPWNPDADPFDFAFGYGRDLLNMTGPFHTSTQALYGRYWRLKTAGNLPSPPDDETPHEWIKHVIRRTTERIGASERAVFLLSTALPQEVNRLRLTANQATIDVVSSLSEYGDPNELRQALGLAPLPPKPLK